jgi:hypothetical protein
MGLCPKPRDLTLSSRHALQTGRLFAAASCPHLSRRSGSIPGEPCPPLRHDQHSGGFTTRSLYLFIARDFVSKSGALGRSITQRRPRGDIPAYPEILPQSCLRLEPNLSTAESVSGRAISSLPSRARDTRCLRQTRRLHGNLDAQSNGKNDCPPKEKYLTAIR